MGDVEGVEGLSEAMGGETFMVNPSDVFGQWMGSTDEGRAYAEEKGLYATGQLAIALELLTTLRVIEGMGERGETSLLGLNWEVVTSVLITFLTGQELFDEAVALYELLGEWRRTKLVEVGTYGGLKVIADPTLPPNSPPYLVPATTRLSDDDPDADASDGEAHR
jgi:hypothetical protein